MVWVEDLFFDFDGLVIVFFGEFDVVLVICELCYVVEVGCCIEVNFVIVCYGVFVELGM